MAKAGVGKQFEDAVKSKNYPDQLKYGKQLLAVNPDSPAVLIVMGVAGLYDANVLAESAEAAKKAISMIEAGKPFAPIATKDQALGYLNWVVAKSIGQVRSKHGDHSFHQSCTLRRRSEEEPGALQRAGRRLRRRTCGQADGGLPGLRRQARKQREQVGQG